MKLRTKQKWGKEAKAFFRQITHDFELNSQHISLFYGTIEHLNTFYLANDILKSEGLVIQPEGGQSRKNPAFQISKDSWSGFIIGLKALGLHEFQSKGLKGGDDD